MSLSVVVKWTGSVRQYLVRLSCAEVTANRERSAKSLSNQCRVVRVSTT
jgi:hypothetical protein